MAATTDLNLPLLATELVQAQSHQSDNLNISLEALKELNRKIAEVESRNKEVQLDLYQIDKEMCTLRCNCGQSHARTEQLAKELEAKAEEKCKLTHDINQMQDALQQLRSRLLKSRKKMTTFAAAARLQEHKRNEFQSLELAKDTVTHLKMKCKALSEQLTLTTAVDSKTGNSPTPSYTIAGDVQAGFSVGSTSVVSLNRQAHLEMIKEQTDKKSEELDKEIADLESKVQEVKTKKKTALQSKQLAKKRQAAQLTRLRRQVQDVHQRNRRWRSVAAQYRQQIAVARRQLQQQQHQ